MQISRGPNLRIRDKFSIGRDNMNFFGKFNVFKVIFARAVHWEGLANFFYWPKTDVTGKTAKGKNGIKIDVFQKSNLQEMIDTIG